MSAPRWAPPIALSKRETLVMSTVARTKKLFGFLREHRHELFDEAFQTELEGMYRESGEGRTPVPPALMAMALLLQGYTGASDAETVHLTMVDARWQMVLDHHDSETRAFSQGALVAFRERLIKHDMDRRLLERTVELAREKGTFDFKKLPHTLRVAVDSRPLVGAGRVEDTFNLLGRAGRILLKSAAKLAAVDPAALARDVGAEPLLASSIKRGLDVADWGDANQRDEALGRLLSMLDALEVWVRESFEAEAEQPPLSEQLELIETLREQNIDPEPPDNGGRRVLDGVAPDRITSLSDPSQRHGRKSTSKTFVGYKSHLATELEHGLVLAAAITPANRPEAEGLDLMRDDLFRMANDNISELHVDRAYVHAAYAVELRGQGVLFFSKPRSIKGSGGLFDKTDFKFNWRSKTARCPADQVVDIRVGAVARFDADTCNACPLRKKCTSSRRGRTISIPADEHLQRKLRKLSATRSGRAKQRERVGIEHRLAHHAQKQGRKARFRGLPKNLLDARRHAAIINLEVIDRDLRMAA
jgi:hypothetical protein